MARAGELCGARARLDADVHGDTSTRGYSRAGYRDDGHSMLGMHFVVPGRLAPAHAKDLTRLEQFRNEADY